MGSRITMRIVNSILLSLELSSNPVQLLTLENSSDGATILKNFSVNNPIDSPPNTQRHLLGIRISLRRYACLTSAQSLAPVHVVNVQHPLPIASDKMVEALVVEVRCH